jgi:purine-binding chemotaxis protein CheW
MGEAERREQVDAVLAERARLLAQPLVEASVVASVDLVQFSAGNERYAIEAAYVRRLERLGNVTPLPGAPRYFAGITNLHGQLVPLIDLRVLLGAAPSGASTFAVVLGDQRAEIGIVAEELLAMPALPPDALGTRGDRPTLVRNILPDGSAVIDGAALIDDPRLVIGEIAPDTHEENRR